MRTLLYGLVVATVGLSGTAATLAMVRLVLVQVRDLARVARQLVASHEEPAGRWEFADCAAPPGWLRSPQRPGGGRVESWQRDGCP